MYKGEHMRSETKTRSTKFIALLVSMVLLVVGAVGGTVAYIVAHADPVENVFEATSVPCEVEEKFDGQVKTDVKIENQGNIDAYIRAKVVITWQDKEGNVAAQVPVENEDYTIEYAGDDKWFQKDGYWYCSEAVAPDETTPILIARCEPVKEKVPDGYYLSVEILAESIQSSPDDAASEAWGISASNGTITGEGE